MVSEGRDETYVSTECAGIADELARLLGDLEPGLAVVPACGDHRARGPELVDEVRLLQARREEEISKKTSVEGEESHGDAPKDP